MGNKETELIPKVRATTPIAYALKRVRDAIKNEEPFVFTRIGDGESYLIRSHLFGEEMPKKREKQMFVDWQLPTDLKKALSEITAPIFKGMEFSNLVGLGSSPTVNIPAYLVPKNVSVCAAGLSQRIGDPNQLNDLLHGKGVAVITNHGDTLEKNLRPFVKNLNVIHLDHNLGVAEYQDRINNLQFEEPVVMWGYGYAKDIGILLRDRLGKTCLDMGSVLDAWRGLATRGCYRGVPGRSDFRHCVIYPEKV